MKTSSRIEWRRLPADSARSVRNIWTILTKELNSFFCTSIGYTVILGYVLTTSLFFLLILHFLREQGAIPATSRPLTVFFSSGYILIIFMFLCSILSMRLFAREREMGTIEMLLTVPVSDWEVVLGKYLATVVYYLICISPSLVNSLVLFRPEFTLHLHGSIILPTLIILPLLLLLFTVMPRILQAAAGLPRSRDIVAVALMFAVTLVTALALRAAGVDRITQMTHFIPADQVDTDNDGMADWWEAAYGLDPTLVSDREDPDRDGDVNMAEYTYSTDPTDREDNITRRIRAQIAPRNEAGPTDTDLDRDGIPDKYEQYLGLSSENGRDGAEDNDGDGDSNALEWAYGTDHRNAADNLRSRYLRELPLVNMIASRFADRDHDGMPDQWEASFGLSIQENNGDVDADGDGYLNIDEYHYRTDPTRADSVPRLPESQAWLLHVLSYILAVGLFLFLGFRYTRRQESRAALHLRNLGIAGLAATIVLLGAFAVMPIRSDAVYSGFLFWGFTAFFIAITAILSRMALLSRSRLNAAAVAVFLFLMFRLFWCFYIAAPAASPPDVGITFAGHAGALLVGAFFIAAGMFFSALFKNQIDAAVVTFAFLLTMQLSASLLPGIIAAFDEWREVFNHFNPQRFLVTCSDGNVTTGSMVFFVSGILLFIFLTVRVLGMRKWR